MDNNYGFPYEPYSIQKKLMQILYCAVEERKLAILESPTGTGKSLSTICALLSWLKDKSRNDVDEVERQIGRLTQSIKDVDEDEDWINAHGRKLEFQKELADFEAKKAYRQLLEERLEKAKKSVKLLKQRSQNVISTKRKANESDQNENGEEDLIPAELAESLSIGDEEADEKENKVELRCAKIIYASRTHSQLEQFAAELLKTEFRPRILTVGSRQLLCVNDAVNSLHYAPLINDRCNELLNAKSVSKHKRAKGDDCARSTASASAKCGCEFFKSDAIEDLTDQILAGPSKSEKFTSSWLLKAGKNVTACPYFASRNASPMCELVLVPYNILLHKATREAWNLDLKDNVVVVDEAHNLLQTLSSIHSCELDEHRIASCCSLIDNYIDRFGTRLSPHNFLHIRHLQTFANRLLSLMRNLQSDTSISDRKEIVYTLPRFLAMLNCADIDFFKLLSYLESSNLCRKLRDFGLRYSSRVLNAKVCDPHNGNDEGGQIKSKSSRFGKFLQKSKKENNENENDGKPQKEKECAEVRAPPTNTSSTPLYQLKEFLEALTTKAEDARILVQKGTSTSDGSKYRFLLLNPAEKLKEIVSEARSFVLIGGTMKPVDQLLDAFERVCSIPRERIVQFSCGHVIDDSQLIALSIAHGPSKMELNFSFAQRDNRQIVSEIARSFVNLLRHVPNGVVAFFPSYAFLANFINSIKNTGEYEQLNKIKPIFLETRSGESAKLSNVTESVWQKFCKEAKTANGALLLAVVGGSLSEGINFSDELGRCVIMVGLPYPNKNSMELSERMKYVEEKIGNGAGSRFYESLCIHSVNQAIGRAIRHRNDYAAIILLDTRYLRQNISCQLPGWIRERLVECEMFHESLSKVIKFFRTKKEI